MKPELEKILSSLQNLAFLEVDRDLNILEYSLSVQRFAEHSGELQPGTDSRMYFPEFVGLEEPFTAVLLGEEEQFELTAIFRETPNGEPLYFNFYAVRKTDDRLTNHQTNNSLMIFFQDVTKENVLERKYVQITNDVTLVNQNLSAYKNYLQYIIQYMGDSLFVTNSTGEIEQCNQVAQNLLETSEDELRNKRIHQIFKEIKLFPRNLQNSSNLLNQILFKDLEVNYTKKSGVSLTILFNCSVIQIDDLQRNFVYIGRDITERKKAEKEIHMALQKERELNELKSNFLAMTNHEFRTPLTVILSSAEILEFNFEKGSDIDRFKYISKIKNSVENLMELLDNMRLIDKAEASKMNSIKTLINIENFCKDLVEEVQLGSQCNRISIISNCKGLICSMNDKLLWHILENILSNALKYSLSSTIVYFRIIQEKKIVVFEIEDQGIGISSEDKKNIFELFYRGSNVANIPGTGLGLAIVKKYVEIHGGSLMVSSEVGVGTNFKVKLPLN